eukprot:TRINITY_DN3678_c0_g1_i13.p1 TRINITY_DN3678_c0_g1~~TRINITY_DN3678_c0_g1_i13.p1  ORF type:complete len:280 (-),score=46.43 TRINITY_DN3678_c0_g1_i13:76-915(-)
MRTATIVSRVFVQDGPIVEMEKLNQLQLRQVCRDKGLPVFGSKKVILERLADLGAKAVAGPRRRASVAKRRSEAVPRPRRRASVASCRSEAVPGPRRRASAARRRSKEPLRDDGFTDSEVQRKPAAPDQENATKVADKAQVDSHVVVAESGGEDDEESEEEDDEDIEEDEEDEDAPRPAAPPGKGRRVAKKKEAFQPVIELTQSVDAVMRDAFAGATVRDPEATGLEQRTDLKRPAATAADEKAVPGPRRRASVAKRRSEGDTRRAVRRRPAGARRSIG